MHKVDLSKTLATWQADRVAIRSGANPGSVLEAFRSIGSHPTPDVVELYGQVDGFEDLAVDNEGLCLWTLDRLKAENVKAKSPHGVYFADFLLDAWWYLFVPRGDYSAVFRDNFDDKGPYEVAPTLAAFFAGYATDPASVLESRS